MNSQGSPQNGPGRDGGGPYHNEVVRQLEEAASALADRIGAAPSIGLVLGSGLGGFAEHLESPSSVPYEALPHFPPPSVPGHAGRFVLGRLQGHPVLCASGRVHLYERHPVESVVLAVRAMARLGCQAVLLTNAAGGIRADLGPGSLMLIRDHINLTGENPVAGFPEPFVDMTRAYDAELCQLGKRAATEAGVEVADGIYAGLRGPTYETPAEVRMLGRLGADAVGMSTVLETIALRREGVRVGALSCITNLAAGLSEQALSHDEVREVASRVEDELTRVLSRWAVLAAEQGGARRTR